MSAAFHGTDLSLLAARLAATGGSSPWMALVVKTEDVAGDVADQLQDVLREIADVDVQRIHASDGELNLAREASQAPASVLVISGLEALSSETWQQIDLVRSSLQHPAGVVLVGSQRTFARLAQHAPNLLSWLGALDVLDSDAGQLSEQERQERIAALERWAGMSSRDVIARGERGELPPDPEYGEWLVLLDREDLLAH